MVQKELILSPEEYYTPELLWQRAAQSVGLAVGDLTHVEPLRQSIDSRRGIRIITTVAIYYGGEIYEQHHYQSPYRDCRKGRRVVIVGAGPAGLFAALRALELGWKPIIVEKGHPVDQRHKDIVQMVRSGIVNSESNWCFGEGGAGTYSDGKLYTRATKRGSVEEVIGKLIEHGADPKIAIDAHAHVGTDKLSGIIANIRRTIEGYGGEYHFGKQVIDLIVRGGKVCGVCLTDGESIEGEACILATGHSSREVYELFHQRGWALQAKPFAMGVRVEHPQQLINEIQYHGCGYSKLLPPAAYTLKCQVSGHGVFSFCMCPGGIIVPAATGDGQQVVNGMSNAARNSSFANSGIAVTISMEDIPHYQHHGVMALLRFQQAIEQQSFTAAGGNLRAPTQRLTDFCQGRGASTIGKSNYMGECVSVNLDDVLPSLIAAPLKEAFRQFGRKMRGFYTREAHLLAVESRTSSPIRIPRGATGEHIELQGLYPCGEGAGYAGGIVSSALDGMKTMEAIDRNNKQ